MVLKVETQDGTLLSIGNTIKKNWAKTKGAIFSILIGLGVAILVQLLVCAQQIIEVGNGDTFVLFLKIIIGELITAVTSIGSLLAGVTEKAQAKYLAENNKIIIDADGDGVPETYVREEPVTDSD